MFQVIYQASNLSYQKKTKKMILLTHWLMLKTNFMMLKRRGQVRAVALTGNRLIAKAACRLSDQIIEKATEANSDTTDRPEICPISAVNALKN